MWINRAEVEDNCSEKIKGCGKRMKSLWKIKKWSSAVFQSITIEAALAIPLFLFAVICLIYLIEVRNIRLVLHNASQSAAKETVEDLAVLPVFNSVKMQQKIIKNIGEERLERSLLDGGTSAISCWKSYYDMVHGEVNICVEYKVKLPIPLPGNYSAKYAENQQYGKGTDKN